MTTKPDTSPPEKGGGMPDAVWIDRWTEATWDQFPGDGCWFAVHPGLNETPYLRADLAINRSVLRELVEDVDGNSMTDGVCRAEFGPCGDPENFVAPCNWCEFKAEVLALLDA